MQAVGESGGGKVVTVDGDRLSISPSKKIVEITVV